jgi:TRAP-type C4-dicarboxylate transport system permease small subunit
MRQLFLAFSDAIDHLARLIVIGLMAVMCVAVFAGVFFRYVLGDPLSWTEEVSRYLMIWLGFLATGLALREGGHVAIDAVIERFPRALRRWTIFFTRVLCMVFLITVVITGAMLVQRVATQTTPVLDISLAWAYAAIPVGCLLIAIELVTLMIRQPDPPRAAQDLETALNIQS